MKCSCLIILLTVPVLLAAQKYQVSMHAGHTLPAVLKVNAGKYRAEASMNYGASISISVPDLKGIAKRVFVELEYNHQKTELAYTKFSTDSNYRLGSIDMSTVLAGASTEFSDKAVRPFAGIMAGMSFLNDEGTSFPGVARITVSVLCGAKVTLTPYAGLRFQGQLLMPAIYNNSELGMLNGVPPGGVVVSMNFSGGLYIQIK